MVYGHPFIHSIKDHKGKPYNGCANPSETGLMTIPEDWYTIQLSVVAHIYIYRYIDIYRYIYIYKYYIYIYTIYIYYIYTIYTIYILYIYTIYIYTIYIYYIYILYIYYIYTIYTYIKIYYIILYSKLPTGRKAFFRMLKAIFPHQLQVSNDS